MAAHRLVLFVLFLSVLQLASTSGPVAGSDDGEQPVDWSSASSDDGEQPIELSSASGRKLLDLQLSLHRVKQNIEQLAQRQSGGDKSGNASDPFHYNGRQSVLMARAINQHGRLLNADGDYEQTRVFALLVHRKTAALSQLIKSLRLVQDIEKAVLVVSMDGVFPSVWETVHAIDFMPVKVLVNPYSPHLQSNAHQFPGDDPRFAAVVGQAGDKTLYYGYDQYKNVREVRVTSLKHHWWWTMNTLFAGRAQPLPPARTVFYLEDDWVVSPDYLLAAQSLDRWAHKHCDGCLLGMGSHHPRGVQHPHGLTYGDPGSANLGLVLTAALWKKLTHTTDYCTFDEYNWDWTLKHVFTQTQPAYFVTLTVPRVRHMGKCGLHGDKSIVDVEAKSCAYTQTWSDWEDQSKKLRAPSSLPSADAWTVASPYSLPKSTNQGFGGWGSDEDHQHCIGVQRGLFV